MKFEFKLDAKGPLFDKEGPTRLGRAVQGGIRELVQRGEERLAEELRPSPGGVFLSVQEAKHGTSRTGGTYSQASTGHYRRSIATKFKDLSAVITDGRVVYGPWLEGVGSRNQTTRFKGYFTFRRTEQWLQTKAEPIFKAHIRRFVTRMNA